MKNILSKSISFLTIFAMVFMSNIAIAQQTQVTVCHQTGNGSVTLEVSPNAVNAHLGHGDTLGACEGDSDTTEQEVCVETEYVSDNNDATLLVGINPTVNVSPINAGWTASIPGAEWVWSENPITNSTVDTTVTFTKTFTIVGTPTDITLDIAADNSYEISVNGNLDVFVDAFENNYASGPTAAPGDGQDNWTIPAAYLQTGLNTITFEVTNMGLIDSDPLSNPARLLYKLSVVNCEPVEVDESCPVVYAKIKFSKVANGADIDGWRNWGGVAGGADMAPDAYVGGSGPTNKYDDEEFFPLTNPDGSSIIDADLITYKDVPGLAIQRLNGKVRVVLHADHTGAELGGKELAAGFVELTPNATFTPGMISPLSWDNLNTNPRMHNPLLNDAANPMDGRGTYTGYINQYDHRFDRMRTATPQRVAFHLVANTGSDGFYASYTKETNENCGPVETPSCEETAGMPVYARIIFSNDPNSNWGVRNWGTGNLARKVYVGGNIPANEYESGEWFMIYDGTNYINDPDIAAYEDVAGLAVQRLDGQLRVVLHGTLTQPEGDKLANRERAQASIEFSNDMLTRSTNAVPTSQANDAANPYDYEVGYDTNHPKSDNVQIVDNLSQFKFVVTEGDDGFYTNYTHTQGEDCEDDESNIPQN